MQKPSVGRIVHFTAFAGNPKPTAAIITSVLPEEANSTDVTLTLFIAGEPPEPMHRWVPFSEEPKAGSWSWPPHV